MNMPKISLGSWAFSFGPFENHPWPFEKVLRYAAEAGYDGVELNGFRPHPHPDDYDTPQKCAELMKQIEGLGLGISGYAPDFAAVPPALVVGALSLLGSCALHRRWHAVIVGSVFLAASFFLNVLGLIADPIRPWRKLSVFYAYSESRPLTGNWITEDTGWLLAATVLLVAAAVFAFRRKELAA